jgi:glycine/D-amino acid oxidase-like deaminating enzyme
LSDETIDLLVIGGGINGAGIARDAAGRGLKVTLVERDDLASATSSWSSKLIHGGLRYLEQYEFKLVREALQEREVLLRLAPHIIRPLLFVLPHDVSMRPVWMIRAGPLPLRPHRRAHLAAGLQVGRVSQPRVQRGPEGRFPLGLRVFGLPRRRRAPHRHQRRCRHGRRVRRS